ncbi:diaminopimelate decarboxylase [Vogesella indigofera]|uniref:Diaminopimelate decarboxylase n=1 Tax=Vogesella indigofera TaxID=45465 RepID=A0A495BIB3_VOGIN|nr:Y4yA family PLP-dependent enzyme [Vogesella indigofera]RKQ60848.1 diaminopimelate decarboxylase [Vogesella indigofera]
MQSHTQLLEAETGSLKAWTPGVLRPILDPAVADIVYSSPQSLLDLVERYGSPLNIVWPHILKQNVEALRAVLRKHQVRFDVFYGAKVNKSQALVRAAVEAGIGVDVSSVYEMRDALRAGVAPARLCATGPAKTREFHAELIANVALISVDSAEELAELEACLHRVANGSVARVLLRYRPASSSASRFGMGGDELLQCLRHLSEQKQRFSFEGFHFHLGGYGFEPRVQALRELIRHVEAARGLGLDPKIIDIGGGLPIRYVDADAYEAFLRAQSGDDYRTGKVPESFYPYGGRLGACEWLDRLLAAPCVDGLSIAGYLNTQQLTLALEPGRSLADQSAVSVFRVTRVKQLASGNPVVFVEGSSFSACETWFASEYLVDPILVSRASGGQPVRAYIAGHSCLDDDVITNRLIAFNTMPQTGDLLVYANTAGYQMDLLENEFHRHPMPRRVTVTYDAAGALVVSPDDRME